MSDFVINPFTGQFDQTGSGGGGGGDVSGPGLSVIGDIATWADITGTTLADSGVAFTTDGSLAANSDNLVPTEKAVKTYVDAHSGQITWNNVTSASATMAPRNGYAANRATQVSLSLPLAGGTQFGNTISVMAVGAGGFRITQNAGQSIIVGIDQSTVGVGGYIEATTPTDAITLVCGPDDLTWRALSSFGNLTVV